MGCAASKTIDVAADAYRPAPASFAIFDIHAIEEPWLKPLETLDQKQQSYVPDVILEKLHAIEDASRTWEEISKALEDIKPKLSSVPAPLPDCKVADSPPLEAEGDPPSKSFNFHTVEELEAKVLSKESKPPTKNEPKPAGALKSNSKKYNDSLTGNDSRNGFHKGMPNSLKENMFIKMDILERQKEGKPDGFVKRDPLSDFEENCPPGGSDGVVLYTTSLGGVRRTYEDCNKLRMIMETHRIVFDERDISLHAGFLNELKELLGEGATVPRVFVKGKYVGGVDEVVHLNETGRLSRILNWARVERGVGRLGCEGCGGARFVPCMDCGGSGKVIGEKKKKCGSCNENGLAQCPVCI